MSKALLIVDVQNDFTEGGALAVTGGDLVAERITSFLSSHSGDYALIVGSRDWHNADSDNGGHFAGAGFAVPQPDFVDTWPVHCVAETDGAAYDPLLDTSFIDEHIFKGMGKPAYSLFEGVTDNGSTAVQLLQDAGITEVDVVGIATDYCVLASASDALEAGFQVRVLADLTAGVAADSSAAALCKLREAGATVVAE
ncbi:isochorismatase family protein [Gleimia coleocanis DSM 15436]|uniref:nicotinamidase n=1 Tax=Gleimia coleocanis DSM 15436 TaxID=525245 RepID=C0W1D3_9ACTO|nr:isochorismatase family protein [Gleimia coleocanis]EEH63506.1 isochorismatase family protein [Gleimia coleocanis DSM 15436]